MRDTIKEFLDEVCSHVRAKSTHKEIRTELVGHIEEMENNGTTLDEAVLSMGDCTEIGQKLDQQHRPQTEWSLIGLVAFIVAIGAAMMLGSNVPAHINVWSHFIWSVIGVAIAAGIMFFDYTKLKKFALPIYLLAMIFLMVGFFGNTFAAGAMRVRIGPITLSPALAIIPFILAFVGFMDRFRGEGIWGIVKLLILGAISVFILMLVPSMAFALILLTCYAVLLFTAVARGHFSGSKRAQIFLLCGVALALVLFVIITISAAPYRLTRFLAFIIPSSDPYGAGWLNMHLSNVLSNAQMWGVGADIVSHTSYYVMPDAVGNFALANVIISFGWIAGISLVTAIAALIVRMFTVTRKIRNDFGFYISLAAYAVLTSQFVMNVLMNFGLFPMVGIGLPFVSFGGSMYIANMTLVGIILSVWRKNNILRATQKQADNSKIPLFECADGKLIVNLRGK